MRNYRPQIEEEMEANKLIEEFINAENALRINLETLESIKNELIDLYSIRIQSALSERDEPFGDVIFNYNGNNICFNTPKKVFWNQDGLKELLSEGAPVDVEYSVKESIFRDLEYSGKQAFSPYRVVKQGTTTLKLLVNK
jgi:hypothetical protein